MFAENARGKTTLCAILRSLQSGEPGHVLGRTTLGCGDDPKISILRGGKAITFDTNNGWNFTLPNLSIFDSTFVSENVYAGDAVDLAHRRNLYGLIVGKHGVELAHQIERYDADIRDKNTEIRDARAAVQGMVPKGLTVETFMPLPEDPAIDAKINEKMLELKAVRQADQIKGRATLSELTLPAFPPNLKALLGKTIEDVAKDAERRINSQIEAHGMHERGEAWLSEGLEYIQNNNCPFCGQSLNGVTLIAAYKAYFGEEYNALREKIATFREGVATAFGDRAIAQIDRTLDLNSAGVEFWSRYCKITPPLLEPASEIADTLRELRRTALALLDRKKATPLDPIALDASVIAAGAAFKTAQTNVNTYNQAVQTANATIAKKKTATATSNVNTVEASLIRLQAIKKRQEPDAKNACQKYQETLTEKRTLETRKENCKGRLNNHTKKVIGSYQDSINQFLRDFHAGFEIVDMKHGYPGGVASSSYQLLINDVPIDIGDSGSPIDIPSFKNTLSSGDRSTLALAFFLAQLEHDPERAEKIVVFDDPFNSQDSFRKDCTVQKIKKCGENCKQVIVLSHDMNFLKRVWDRLATQPSERKCLHLTRVGVRDTRICAWDIEEATQAPYLLDQKTLADYYHSCEGKPRDVVNKIRPVAETYCKNLYPGEFGGDTLGIIIGKIRRAGSNHQLFHILDDLDGLNEYTRRYHHGENPNWATEPIDETELQGFVHRTLEIVGGC